ncbi:MAG: hypothetical protein ACTTIZ_01870 [Treponema sp.]
MLSIIKNILNELKERFKTMPIIYITILFLGGVIFFYQDVPESHVPIILLSSTIVFFLSDYVTNLSRTKQWIITILTYIFISQIYYFFLTTVNSLVEQSTLSLMYLYLFLSINLYLSSSKNYVFQIKTKVIHVLISFAIFVATYLCLYFSIFFIYTILSKDFYFYRYTYASRIINSVTTIVFFLILSMYKKRENYSSSKFFIFVFSRLVPSMLIFFLSLATIYLLKITIKYDSTIDRSDFNYIVSILTFLIFLSLVMIQITGKIERMLKVLFSLAVLNAIMLAVLYLRYTKLSSSIHYLLIYLLIATYFLVVLLKTKGITYLASYFIALIILIYFIPVIGLLNYTKFINEKDNIMSKNNITVHQERKEKLNKSQRKEQESRYYDYNAPDSSENVRWIIKNENYSDILVDVDIGIYQNNESSKYNYFIYKNYEFMLSKDGKKLIVKNTIKDSIEEFDLYSTTKNTKNNKVIEFNTANFKTVISMYTFNEYNKTVNFNTYFYNDEK